MQNNTSSSERYIHGVHYSPNRANNTSQFSDDTKTKKRLKPLVRPESANSKHIYVLMSNLKKCWNSLSEPIIIIAIVIIIGIILNLLWDFLPLIVLCGFLTYGIYWLIAWYWKEKLNEQVSARQRAFEKYFVSKQKEEIRQQLKTEMFEEANKIYHNKRLLAEAYYLNQLKDIKLIVEEVLKSNPNNEYIANILTDASSLILYNKMSYLSHKAPSTAAAIKKKFKEQARQWQIDARKYKYQVLLYESLFPSLSEFEIQEKIPETEENKKPIDWLPEEEYRKLTDEQKNERCQKSLERYIKGSKSKWEVGRDYELYVGHLFRKSGWNVIHNGISEKLQDMGRDLICHKEGVTCIVQCKFWAQHKTIHEKHIAQLFGTTLSYAVENNMPSLSVGNIGNSSRRVVPVFVTSTKLSDTAMQFANALKVDVRVIEFDPHSSEFPRIKCNIGKEGKIFHLPFDQLYDRVIISGPDEFYATTVSEAVAKGFRRAHRWFGNNAQSST